MTFSLAFHLIGTPPTKGSPGAEPVVAAELVAALDELALLCDLPRPAGTIGPHRSQAVLGWANRLAEQLASVPRAAPLPFLLARRVMRARNLIPDIAAIASLDSREQQEMISELSVAGLALIAFSLARPERAAGLLLTIANDDGRENLSAILRAWLGEPLDDMVGAFAEQLTVGEFGGGVLFAGSKELLRQGGGPPAAVLPVVFELAEGMLPDQAAVARLAQTLYVAPDVVSSVLQRGDRGPFLRSEAFATLLERVKQILDTVGLPDAPSHLHLGLYVTTQILREHFALSRVLLFQHEPVRKVLLPVHMSGPRLERFRSLLRSLRSDEGATLELEAARDLAITVRGELLDDSVARAVAFPLLERGALRGVIYADGGNEDEGLGFDPVEQLALTALAELWRR